MGLFSFLFRGKKKAKAAPVAAATVAKPVVEKQAAEPAAASGGTIVAAPGVVQARLRLKLAASLRTGERAAAYEAAKGLAAIQAKAGRSTCARVWTQQAERIKAGLAA